MQHTLSGHGDSVHFISLQNDLPVTGSFDKTIKVQVAPGGYLYLYNKIWDFSTGQCLYTLGGFNDFVRCARRDATKLIVGSYDGIVTLFDFGVIPDSNPLSSSGCIVQ